jgi:leader peptidase (prepilin peptidase)/N-methyltransferase
MQTARIVLFAVAGLIFGSFLTVLVHRLPRKASIVRPRSACPVCGTPIRPRDNIPVVSYVLLRGRCRSCQARVSPEYPLIEAATGALFVGAALVFDETGVAFLVAVFLGVMLAAGVIDLRHRIVPNRLTYSFLVIFAVGVAALAVMAEDVDAGRAALGLLAYGGGLLAIALVSPGGIGMGDVKLAALIGLVLGALGWAYVGVAVMVAIIAGGLGAVIALLLGKRRKDTIPFGPYLAAGAVVAALAARPIASWYAGLLL